jgi:hypothetical protein
MSINSFKSIEWAFNVCLALWLVTIVSICVRPDPARRYTYTVAFETSVFNKIYTVFI